MAKIKRITTALVETIWIVALRTQSKMITFEHCISLPLMECESHPESVVLLSQIGEDVGVEHSGLQEAAPQSSQLGAKLAHVPADLLRYLLMTILQLYILSNRMH